MPNTIVQVGERLKADDADNGEERAEDEDADDAVKITSVNQSSCCCTGLDVPAHVELMTWSSVVPSPRAEQTSPGHDASPRVGFLSQAATSGRLSIRRFSASSTWPPRRASARARPGVAVRAQARAQQQDPGASLGSSCSLMLSSSQKHAGSVLAMRLP
jgi:hypothetical protein